MDNIISKENCLFYGLPGMAILIISTLVTVNISIHFNENALVTTVAFVGCNVSGWLAYLLLQYLLGDLLQVSDIIRGRKGKQQQLAAQPSNDVQSVVSSTADESSTAQPSSLQETQQGESMVSTDSVSKPSVQDQDEVISNDPIPSSDTISTDEVVSTDPMPKAISQKQYAKANMSFDQRIAAEKAVHERVIMDYVNRIMAPFVEHDDLVNLCAEIHKWCEDSQYRPEAIPLKYFPDFSSRLKTSDFKHFVWNIGERMYNRTAYTGACRAEFIKSLFPDALQENSVDSLKNLTHQADTGHIKLDRPKPDSIAFDKNK